MQAPEKVIVPVVLQVVLRAVVVPTTQGPVRELNAPPVAPTYVYVPVDMSDPICADRAGPVGPVTDAPGAPVGPVAPKVWVLAVSSLVPVL